MNTPITDAVYPPDIIDREFKAQGRTYGWGTLHDMRDVARRLELDRAALMEALELSRETLGKLYASFSAPEEWQALWPAIKSAKAALAAARANFPES